MLVAVVVLAVVAVVAIVAALVTRGKLVTERKRVAAAETAAGELSAALDIAHETLTSSRHALAAETSAHAAQVERLPVSCRSRWRRAVGGRGRAAGSRRGGGQRS